jgi:hypothetical protein
VCDEEEVCTGSSEACPAGIFSLSFLISFSSISSFFFIFFIFFYFLFIFFLSFFLFERPNISTNQAMRYAGTAQEFATLPQYVAAAILHVPQASSYRLIPVECVEEMELVAQPKVWMSGKECVLALLKTKRIVGTCGDGVCNVAIKENCQTCYLDCGPCGKSSMQNMLFLPSS